MSVNTSRVSILHLRQVGSDRTSRGLTGNAFGRPRTHRHPGCGRRGTERIPGGFHSVSAQHASAFRELVTFQTAIMPFGLNCHPDHCHYWRSVAAFSDVPFGIVQAPALRPVQTRDHGARGFGLQWTQVVWASSNNSPARARPRVTCPADRCDRSP